MISIKILLASNSPRRSMLLEQAGFTFRVETKDVKEDFPPDMAPIEVPEFLACKKANAAISLLRDDDDLILAADTIVVLGDKILGKPVDKADAAQILRSLSGTTHLVYTGVCLKNREKENSFVATSSVTFFDLSDEEIDYYIEEFKPFDKAGAYGIQEWLGLCKIEKIAGSYSNIIGLPMGRVYAALQDW